MTVKTRITRQKRVDWAWGYGMILPLLAGLGLFYFYPVYKVFRDSLYTVGAFNRSSWAGLANYTKMFQDSVMWRSLGNTMMYAVIIIPLTVILALILAAMLNTNIRGRDVYRVIYFIPTVTMSVAIAMVWRWIFNGDFGILNHIFRIFGGTPQYWLSDEHTVLLCVSIVSVWMGVGYNMIILLAGIQGISSNYYEAAELEGAGKIRQFLKITIPLVTPTLFFVVITTVISTLQIFDVIYMMIPTKSIAMSYAQSVVMYFYRNAFEYSAKGYASAIAVLLFAIIMLLTLFQMRIQKKWVHYD
ncbi:MAG: sugar ABC transporter permease [Clostridiales bacterium]|nr:sugar ABC transporter permease [Clostridiales bacterium]